MTEAHLPHVEVPHPEEATDRLSRTIAIAIVVATLATAVVGYLHSRADRSVEKAAVNAQRLGILAMGALLRSQQMAQSEFNTFSLRSEEETRAASAFQQYLVTPSGEDTRFKLEQDVYERLTARSEQVTGVVAEAAGLPDVTAGGAVSPEQDPVFPSRFFAKVARDAVRYRALQDAANEYRSDWEGRTATFTAILTIFAVALFLFGLSLTLGGAVRRIFAGVGAGFLLVGFVWASMVAASPPNLAPDRAAEEFAAGTEALQTGSTPADFRGAAAHFERAIDLRPTFALAYQEHATAVFQAGSPQSAGLQSISTKEALETAVDDLQQARSHGLDNVNVLGNLGFDLFELGLLEHDDGALGESVEITGEAIREDPADPALRFNLGVALLAGGRIEEARTTYFEATEFMVYSDVPKKELKGNLVGEEQLVAGALTDLELLAHYRPQLAGEAKRMKESLVEAGSLQHPAMQPPVITPAGASEELETDVFPAELQWVGKLSGLEVDKDTVSVQWYHLDSSGLGWAALPNVSGLDVEPRPELQGGYFDLQSYLGSSSPPSCLPDGRYRVEVYVNGELVGRGETEASFGDLTAVVARDLNVAFCRPQTWEPSDRALAGFAAGFTSADGTEGAYVVRFNQPGPFRDDPQKQQTLELLNLSVNLGNLFPGTPAYDAVSGTDRTYFMGLDAPVKQYFDYKGGSLRAGAGIDKDGAIIVGIVFGPREYFQTGGLGLKIVDSFSILEKLPSA